MDDEGEAAIEFLEPACLLQLHLPLGVGQMHRDLLCDRLQQVEVFPVELAFDPWPAEHNDTDQSRRPHQRDRGPGVPFVEEPVGYYDVLDSIVGASTNVV